MSITPLMRVFLKSQTDLDLANNAIHLVYRQLLVWVSASVFPMVAAISVLVMFVLVYVKEYTLRLSSPPPKFVHPLGSGLLLFKETLLLGFLLSTVPVCWMLVQHTPGNCGPFRGRNHIFDIVVETIDRCPQEMRNVFYFVGSAGFAIPSIILLLVMSYYLRLRAENRRLAILQLRHWLYIERTDTRYLLRTRNIQT